MTEVQDDEADENLDEHLTTANVPGRQSSLEMDADTGNDITTALRSELAALQYKRDKLSSETKDLKGQMLSRDQRVLEQQIEIDHLREQTARHNAIISSLKKKIKDLEERERNLYAAQGRGEIALQTIQRDNRYYEERSKELEKKLRGIELEWTNEEQQRERERCQFQDLVRRLYAALGTDFCESSHSHSPEILVIKATELVQEIARLKAKMFNVGDNLSSAEQELKSCRDALEKANVDKDMMHRQISTQLIEIDKLRQDKESLSVDNRVIERKLHEAKDKLCDCCKNLSVATDNVNHNESLIIQLKDNLKHREEKYQKLQHEFRHSMESIAILLSLPTSFVESHDSAIKERIREILNDNKDKSAQIESLRDKFNLEAQQLKRTALMQEQSSGRARILEDERNLLEAKVHKLDTTIGTLELSRDNLRRDKANFLVFLERLSRCLNMDELSAEVGLELHTDSILHRAEQLSRLEVGKIVDKTAVMYQLQRRIRILREQLQRKDLHLEMLRRKLTLQEEGCKLRAILQAERDEAQVRVKKLSKQVDKLSLQLADSRSQIRDLNIQLADAADFKITALERSRKVEELEKRLSEAELLRARYGHKVLTLREQVRVADECVQRERGSTDCHVAALRDELARTKESLVEATKREAHLQSFRNSVARMLGSCAVSDLELASRLQRLLDAHHDFTLVSRRYDGSRSPTAPPSCCRTRSPDRSLRYDDSGYVDPPDIDPTLDDDLYLHDRKCV